MTSRRATAILPGLVVGVCAATGGSGDLSSQEPTIRNTTLPTLVSPSISQRASEKGTGPFDPPHGIRTYDAAGGVLSPFQTPSEEKLDRATVDRMIKEALAAEAEKKKGESTEIDAGRDFRLRATWSDGFVAHTADEMFRFHFGGRAEFDNSWFTQDPNLLLGTSDTTRFSDGSLFRRARLRADGLLWGWIDFATEVNFANIQDASNVEEQPVQVGSVGLTDFYLTFQQIPVAGNVRVGHFLAPVGLERYSSSNAWYYLERSSLYDAFLDPNNFQNGVLFFNSYWDERVTAAGAFTRIGNATVKPFGFDAADGKYAGSGRLTALPLYADEGRRLMHVGVGFQHQTLVDHQFNVASRPLLRSGSGRNPDTPNVVFTGSFFTPNGASVLDLEWAAVYGPLSFSAEYALARLNNIFNTFDGLNYAGPHGDASYQAYYVEGGWFITPGDYRRYDKQTGTWDRTLPRENASAAKTEDGSWCCGHGAVQLLARYTYLNLADGDPVLTSTSAGAQAGRQHDITLGVNWYLSSQVWVMVNYVWSRIDSVVPGASGDFQAVGTRVHIDF